MADEIFGGNSEPESKPSARMTVPARALNSIEMHLLGQLADVSAPIPPPFVDDDGEIKDGEFAGLPLRTAIDLRNMLLCNAEERLRRQCVTARDLGPERADGGPFVREYLIACEAEGIVPWPVGDPLHHERN